MTDIAALKAKNAARWANMRPNPDRQASFDATARRLCATAAKARYLNISAKTGVPWFIIAVIHEREAGGPPHWDKQLGQGDPLTQVSVHDPKGRGPFSSFEAGAYDALVNCGPYAARWKDWSSGGSLTLLEEYNGLGYAAMGVPSAYVWSGTNQYVSGKYVADHVYRSNVVDVQEGCAAIIASMMKLDSSVKWTVSGVTSPVIPPPPVVAPQKTAPEIEKTPEIRQGYANTLFSFIASLFRRKT